MRRTRFSEQGRYVYIIQRAEGAFRSTHILHICRPPMSVHTLPQIGPSDIIPYIYMNGNNYLYIYTYISVFVFVHLRRIWVRGSGWQEPVIAHVLSEIFRKQPSPTPTRSQPHRANRRLPESVPYLRHRWKAKQTRLIARNITGSRGNVLCCSR